MKHRLLFPLMAWLALAGAARAQNTAFTYQGALRENGLPANGVFDFQFRLYGASNAMDIPLGAQAVADAPVTNGLFDVLLDFGANPFNGNARWMEISVRPGASTGAYTTLAPLQPVHSIPYAITALGVPAGSINSAAIAHGAVTAAKLAANSITAASVGTNMVIGTSNLAPGTVTYDKLASNVVLSLNLARPYEAGLLSSYDFYFRLEPLQQRSVAFNSFFPSLPSLTVNLETLSEAFAESAFPRTENRTTSEFTLKFRITNRLESVVAEAETSSAILGLDSAMVNGRPAVAFPVVGCVITALPSTEEVVTTNCWIEFTSPGTPYFCGTNSSGLPIWCPGVSRTLRMPVPCPGGQGSTVVTSIQPSTIYITNCSSPLLFARSADEAGNSWNLSLVTASSASEPSLTVVNGTPTIAYYSPSLTALRVVKAASSMGTNWNSPVTVANHADVGRFCSLAVVNGRAAVGYFNATSNHLEYVRDTGFGWTAPIIVEGTGGAGRHASLAIVGGQPAIACFRSPIVNASGALVFYRATDINGAGWGGRVTVVSNVGDLNAGSAVTNGSVISLAMVEGRPAIAFYDQSNDEMKFVRAMDDSGLTWGTPVSLPIFAIGGSGGLLSAKGGSCRLAVLGGRPTIQFATNTDLYIVTARDSIGTYWDRPVKLVDGTTSKAWAGGLVTSEGQFASAFQIYQPSVNQPPQVLYTRREPPPFAINWIAVQP